MEKVSFLIPLIAHSQGKRSSFRICFSIHRNPAGIFSKDDLTEIPLPDIRKVLESGNSQELKNIFYGFLSSIPHDNYRNNLLSHFEGYYASVVYAYMASLGYEIIAEDTTNKGRIDLTVKTRTYIWIFEFKVMGIDRSGDMLPIDQIRQRGYAEKCTSDPRQVIEVGIIFNPETRNIERWDVEKPNQ